MNIFQHFKIGLKRTSNLLSSGILESLKSNKIDKQTLDDLETILISADIGLEISNNLIEKIKSTKFSNSENSLEIIKLLAKEIENILNCTEKKLLENNGKSPNIIIFIGVNGSGKTTTIGKFLRKISQDKKILVAACDTFRAAAVEQLKLWVTLKNTDLFQGNFKQDPASVAFDAFEKTKRENYDYLIIDTAGRLSNNTNLLNQLIKIKSVISKSIDEKMIKIILVLDGTNGSNMINQVDIFNKSLNVAGLIITKIDGTAKGGALITIANKYEIPIHYVGFGEKETDLFEFSSKQFSRSILDLEN